MDDTERLRVVLKHLIEHNEGHVEDYKRWIELARVNGMEQVEALLEEANGHVQKASTALKAALDLIK
jgi:hypothetical protein